jgi:phosphoglycolate phosphatase
MTRAAPPFVVEAIAFDLDGTLLDTAQDLAQALNALLVEHGLEALPVAFIRDLIGRGLADLLTRAVAASRGTAPGAGELNAMLARYATHYEAVLGTHTRPYDGVAEALAALRVGGFRLAVVTNKTTRFVAPHLVHAGIADFFDVVVGGDDAAAKKPDAAPIVLAAERLGVRCERLLVVGDSGNDALAARNAGSPVLLVPYGYNEGVPVRSLPSDGIVDSLAQLPALCRRP